MAISIRDAKTILSEVVPKTNVVVMLWGPRGVGKTQLINSLGGEFGYRVVVVRIGQMEVGDLIGMPYVEKGLTVWARPVWWPADDDEPTIVFLDELNRVTDRGVVDSIMQFVLERRLHTHTLAPQHKIVCAGNPPADGYNVSDLDDAAMSRLLHLYIKNPPDTWMAWAQDRIHRDIVEFIAVNQNLLSTPDKGEDSIQVKPNHRAYEMLNEIYSTCDLSMDLLYAVAAGIIGKEPAVVFLKFLKERYDRPVSAREILENYEQVRKKFCAQKERLDLVNASCTDVIAYFQALFSDEKKARTVDEKQLDGYLDNLVRFCGDLPRDTMVALVGALDEIPELSPHIAVHDGLYRLLGSVLDNQQESA